MHRARNEDQDAYPLCAETGQSRDALSKLDDQGRKLKVV